MPEEGRFEDDLVVALRRTGDTFAPDGGGLVAGGVARGRRRVVRRRTGAVAGGVLALALVGVGCAYAAGALGGRARTADVAADRGDGGPPVAAAPPGPSAATGRVDPVPSATAEPPPRAEGGGVSAAEVLRTFRALLPGGELTEPAARGTAEGPTASGVFDDGRGRAAVGIAFFRVAPGDDTYTRCPDAALVPHDGCTTETLPGGARLMVLKGYEYPDKREETKNWRASLVHPDGVVVDLNTWNAPAQKGSAVSRAEPPFTSAQMKAVVSADAWKPVLDHLPDPGGWPEEGGPEGPVAGDGSGEAAVKPLFLSLLPENLTRVRSGGEGDYAYAVVDDGKGRSLVQVNAQPGMGGAGPSLFPPGSYTTLADGTKVRAVRQAGEKGGKDVVWWSVDTLRPSGYRVVVSAFNTPDQDQDATRAKPALDMEQLQTIATSEKWLEPAE
ncbi:hypothetical protein BJP40_10580 [Streptomyces sp. CC53]|nr:hypothetical protein BJP40_10580 [Streptomyces sp. CC53]